MKQQELDLDMLDNMINYCLKKNKPKLQDELKKKFMIKFMSNIIP